MSDPTSALAAWLREHTRFQRLLHVASCASTQALAQETAQEGDQPGPTVFWADHQTEGRGRDGRSWVDRPGQDVLVTFKLHGLQFENPAHLAATVPVAIVRALEPHLSDPLQIKWPNDVLLHGRKLAGLLIDSFGRERVTHLVGIGINVNSSRFPAELMDEATSLALATGRELNRHLLLRDLARELEAGLQDLEAGRQSELEEVFRQRLGLVGRRVRLVAGADACEGRLLELDFEHVQLEGQAPVPLAHVQRLDPAAG